MAMKHEALVPSQAQVVEFRVGALLSAQATAVTIDREGLPEVGRGASGFDQMPEPVKIRVAAGASSGSTGRGLG